jgi:hypothetical protein
VVMPPCVTEWYVVRTFVKGCRYLYSSHDGFAPLSQYQLIVNAGGYASHQVDHYLLTLPCWLHHYASAV